MRILAVDTSGKEIGIGIFSGKKCLYENYIKAERSYNRIIMPVIKAALLKAGAKPESIEVFAAALGPGSFTGIRVGMAVMKSFCHGLGKKFAGVSTLDILAASAGVKGRVWAVLEAGRTEVYAAKYGKSGIRTKYMLLSREKFLRKLKKNDTVAGMTAENIMVELKEKKCKINTIIIEHIDMKAFARLIREHGEADKKGIYETGPVYIRSSAAEEKRKIRKKAEVK